MIESVFLTVHPRRSCTRDLSRIAGSNDSHNLLNRSSTFQKHLYESLILPPPQRGRTQPPDLFTPRFCSVLCKRGGFKQECWNQTREKMKGAHLSKDTNEFRQPSAAQCARVSDSAVQVYICTVWAPGVLMYAYCIHWLSPAEPPLCPYVTM